MPDASGGILRRMLETCPDTEPIPSWSVDDAGAEWWRRVEGTSYISAASYFSARSAFERRCCDAVCDDMQMEMELHFSMYRS